MKTTIFGVLFHLSLALPTQALEIGDPLPPCVLDQLQNKQSITLPPQSEQIMYVDFWASWCAPCAKSFPFLNNLHQTYKDQGLNIIAVNLDEIEEDAFEFLNRFPAHFTVAKDPEQQCAQQLQVSAMPSSYLVDKQGIIRYIHLGFRESHKSDLEAQVTQLLSGI